VHLLKIFVLEIYFKILVDNLILKHCQNPMILEIPFNKY